MTEDLAIHVIEIPEICRVMEVLKMFSQNEMERELYEGRLKEKRDRQTFETQLATALRERDEVTRKWDEAERKRDEAARERDEARRHAAKIELVGRIQLCERLLKRPASDPDELIERSEEELRQLAERLERELTPSSE